MQKALLNKNKGFLLIELVLSAALFSIFSLAIILAVMQSSASQQSGVQAEKARQWAVEGIEAVRSLRSQSFDALENTAGSGIQLENDKWKLSGSQDEWEGYVRTIKIEQALRDGDGNLVSSGGDEDADLKRVTVTVVKNDYSIEFLTYLSRRETIPIAP